MPSTENDRPAYGVMGGAGDDPDVMPSVENDAASDLAERIRLEADVCSRAGQYHRLMALADDVEALGTRAIPPGEKSADA
jgi:hypothetical protein